MEGWYSLDTQQFPPTVGTKKAGEMLRLSSNTISKYCREGVFPNVTHDDYGSPWQIPITDIEAFKDRKKPKNSR